MKIGALARHADTTAPTIRYYEEIGLLPRPGRATGGQRHYGAEDVARLTFIRRCRSFGFSVAQVRALMQVMTGPHRDCQGALDLAREHLSDVRARMAELRALEATLTDIVRTGEEDCPGGRGPDCTVLRALKTDDAARAQA